MDRLKKVKNLKINNKTIAFIGLVVGVLFGAAMISGGIFRILSYQSQMGDKSSEELSSDISSLSAEYSKVESDKLKEYDENGISEKYQELNARSAELSKEISKATNSRYMKETGFNNPKNLDEVFKLAPMIPVGAIVVAVGVVIFVVYHKK